MRRYFHLLTSGTGLHLVCQAIPAYSSTPNPNVGDYKRRTGLSPPAAYPLIMGNEANEGSLKPRHHVYTIDYYSSVYRVIRLYQGPLLEYPLQERTTNPQANKNKA